MHTLSRPNFICMTVQYAGKRILLADLQDAVKVGPQRRILVAGEAAKQQPPELQLRKRHALVLRQQPEVLLQQRLRA